MADTANITDHAYKILTVGSSITLGPAGLYPVKIITEHINYTVNVPTTTDAGLGGGWVSYSKVLKGAPGEPTKTRCWRCGTVDVPLGNDRRCWPCYQKHERAIAEETRIGDEESRACAAQLSRAQRAAFAEDYESIRERNAVGMIWRVR